MTTETPLVEAPQPEQTEAQKDAAWSSLIAGEADAVTLPDTEVVPETFSKQGDILNHPTEEVPAAFRLSSLKFKGYVPVWDTLTGREALQPWWLLWQTMRKTREDGSLVWTRVNPKILPDHGQDFTCPLNPEAEDDMRFSGLKGMGFKNCKKKHIPYMDALLQHIKKSHKRAWDAIESTRQERERQEYISLTKEGIATQNRFMEALLKNNMGAELDTATGEVTVTETPYVAMGPTIVTDPLCIPCNRTFSGPGGTHNLSQHTLKEHPTT